MSVGWSLLWWLRRFLQKVFDYLSMMVRNTWNTWCLSLYLSLIHPLWSLHVLNQATRMMNVPLLILQGICHQGDASPTSGDSTAVWTVNKDIWRLDLASRSSGLWHSFPWLLLRICRDFCVLCAAAGSNIGSVQAEYHPSSAETPFKADVLCQLPSTIMEPAAQCRHSLCRMIEKNNNWIKPSDHYSCHFRIGMNALASCCIFLIPWHKNATTGPTSLNSCSRKVAHAVCLDKLSVSQNIDDLIDAPKPPFPSWNCQMLDDFGVPHFGKPQLQLQCSTGATLFRAASGAVGHVGCSTKRVTVGGVKFKSCSKRPGTQK